MDTTALSEQRTEQRFFAQGRGDDRGHQWSVTAGSFTDCRRKLRRCYGRASAEAALAL